MDNKILRKRTFVVILITFVMMIAEIYYGITTNSMALTADGLHMGTHVIAFLITLVVCIFAINNEDKAEKLNALGGYTSAIFLGLTSLGIIYESAERFYNPLNITFGEALTVAIIGLVVNLICIIIMGNNHNFHNHNHSELNCECLHHHENLNYKAAYLHIVADILTSVLAIAALLIAKYTGFITLDPVIGIISGIVIGRWSWNLIISSVKTILD